MGASLGQYELRSVVERLTGKNETGGPLIGARRDALRDEVTERSRRLEAHGRSVGRQLERIVALRHSDHRMGSVAETPQEEQTRLGGGEDRLAFDVLADVVDVTAERSNPHFSG